MKETSFLAAIVTVSFLASLCITSVAAYIPVEETKRDPTEPGTYDPPPGESFSWCYQYAHYDPQTKKYSNIQQDHHWDKKCDPPPGAYYNASTPGEADEYHPWVQTYVEYQEEGWEEPMIDTLAEIQW